MNRIKMLKSAVPFFLFPLTVTCGLLQAQTVAVAPSGYVTVGPGGTQQYTATVTGATGSAAVIWLVADIVGGNSTVGTISPTGLYTAPATVSAYSSEGIKAELASNTRISGSQAITLLTAGPQITSITPNPLKSGNTNVTITGTGFQAGTTVLCNSVQLSNNSLNATTITSGVYMAPGVNSLSCAARTPESAYGNTFTVPVGSGGTTAPVISPATVTVKLSGTEQFSAPGTTSWTAVSGTVTAAGLYTAPATMPASGSDTVTASNSAGKSVATVTLKAAGAPVISPATVTLKLSGTEQFSAPGATSWTAVSGTVTAAGLYTAPATMPASGTDTVTASNSAGKSVATVTLQAAAAPVISPATVTLKLSGTEQFSAPGATNWAAALGTVTAAGLYTAPATMPASGSDTVTASNSSGKSVATVTLQAAAAPVISPATASVMLTKTQQFNAPGTTSWTAVSGTVTAAGLYTAPATMPASGSDTVTASNSSGKSVATVTLLTNIPPVISPAAVSVMLTKTQQFAAPGATSWTAVSGTVTASGLYTAPATMPASGTDIVTAMNAAGSSSATVNLESNVPPVIAPATVTVMLTRTQQVTAPGATGWTAVSGTVTASGLYSAPATMPASGTDTVTATNAAGSSSATVTLTTNIPPTVVSIGTSPLPLGVFATALTGTGFTAQSQAQLGAVALTTTYVNATTLNISGFAGPTATENLTVSNGALVSAPLAVPVGVANPAVSVSAARRFLEQAAFGPTPADAANIQALGFQGWINQQLAMPAVSNYNALLNQSQGGLAETFLANAVTNSDQLRQRVAFALSEIFTISVTKIIWDGDMAPYENMLLNDAFSNYGKILSDVTLSPGMGEYLDMANNAAANPAAGTVANENYARELMQLFSMGDVMLNQDGSVQTDASGNPIPTYLQPTVAELARVFTGWTYTQGANPPLWGAYINSSAPMVPYPPEHDFGSKTLLNGYVAPANLTMQQDLQGALNNIISHPNVAPFISKQLIQHLLKSNPSPAYVQRVAQAFTASNGDMPTVITAILLDPEARANDAGGNDQPTDGHLQEPALFVPGIVRAFSGTMTTANYYQQSLAAMGQDIYNPASVFSYFSPGYLVPGAGGLMGPEFEIDTPNAAILRENLVAELFSQWSNPVQNYGPGTVVDLTPFLPLASNPQNLLNALDVTLTHGTMPAAMKQIIVTAVTADQPNGALFQVEEAVYLILESSYYNVWH